METSFFRRILFYTGWFATSMPVGKVAKAMRIDAEKFFKGHSSEGAEKPTPASEIFDNAGINALCSEAWIDS